MDYLLNGVIFILIGLQFPSIIREMRIPVSQMIFIGAVISFVVIAVRFLWVFPLVYLERHLFRRGNRNSLSFGGLVVVSWAGMRGVVSLAAALALPLTSEGRARICVHEELIAEIDGLVKTEETPEYRESLERWSIHYQDRLRVLKKRLALPVEMSRYAANKDRDVLPKLMNQARQHLARMRSQGEISEEVRRRIEQDFDMEERRIKRLLARMGSE